MRRDVQGFAGEGKCLWRIPMSVLEMADDKHGEAGRSGVGSKEREIKVPTVRAENSSGLVEVSGDEIRCKKRGAHHALAWIIWSPRNRSMCGERNCRG